MHTKSLLSIRHWTESGGHIKENKMFLPVNVLQCDTDNIATENEWNLLQKHRREWPAPRGILCEQGFLFWLSSSVVFLASLTKITLPPDSWEFCPLFGSVCLFAFLALRTRPRDGMVPGQMHRLFSSLEGFQKFFPTPPVSSLSYPQGQLIETVTVLLKPASAALSADNFLRLPKRPRFRNLETVRIQHYPFLVFCLSLLGCHRSRGYAL